MASLQWQAAEPQITKAEKNGLESVIGHLEVLDAFYEVFARNMRDLGTPVYSKSFFGNILEHSSTPRAFLLSTMRRE